MTSSSESDLINAIGTKTVRALASRLIDDGAESAALAEQVLVASDAIIARVEREVNALNEVPGLADAGLRTDPSGQLHAIAGTLGSWEHAAPTVAELRELGWVTWHDLTGAAEAALYRSSEQVTLAHLEAEPLVLELSWTDAPFTRLPKPLRPAIADVSLVELPGPLWPLYAAVRPLRLAAEKAGRLTPRSRSLGPILSTPHELIPLLLDLADVSADDHLVDLGCGEGRVVVEAARQTQCRVTGVETDARLVKRARTNISEQLGSQARATIIHGDARTFDLSDATVVFLFVPNEVVAEIVRQIRAKGFSGRIVSHEQAALPPGATPASSHVLATDGALTVAHLW